MLRNFIAKHSAFNVISHRPLTVCNLAQSSADMGAGKTKVAAATEIGFNLTEEQQEYKELARKFTREEIIPNAARHDLSMEYPTDILKKVMHLYVVIHILNSCRHGSWDC